MLAILFGLKNYLYAKNNVKFIVPVLAVFLCTSCLSSVVKHKGFSTEIKDKTSYDMPPIAPIPPEKFCFEQNGVGGAKTTAELFIMGDSTYGKIDYAKNLNLNSGEFSGVVYGATLLINYKFKTDSGLTTQYQKWRFSNDSLYRVYVTSSVDSSDINSDSLSLLKSDFASILRKTPCR